MVSGEDVVATMASLWPSPGGFLSNALRFRTIVAVCSAYSVLGPEVPSYVAPLCPKLPPESEYPFVNPTSPGGTPSNVSRPSTTSNETFALAASSNARLRECKHASAPEAAATSARNTRTDGNGTSDAASAVKALAPHPGGPCTSTERWSVASKLREVWPGVVRAVSPVAALRLAASPASPASRSTARNSGGSASRALLCGDRSRDPVPQEHSVPSGRSAARASLSAPRKGRTSVSAALKSAMVTFWTSCSPESPFSPDCLPVSIFARYRPSACDCAAPTAPLISAPE
mmetsp:Transcript_13603/g.50882  ORF Transcript_13603/g.50882 Transcript_13603/m.50882 type:complete len:288 (-) Transcript_13603:1340-2203(-)